MIRESGIAELAARGATIHLMGIGGAGMAGLALLAQARGATISGCDRESSDTIRDLRAVGMTIHATHNPEHVRECAAVIHTAAIGEGHPELEAARAAGVPVVKRSRALADLVNVGHLIAVGGTHGKTTTTALTAMALEAAGVDPTALVGGRVTEWSGNARIGGGDVYVIEADEYDRSFLALWPRLAVITSVEAEHLDTYGGLGELEAAFDEFVARVPEDGRVIACADDAGARRRLERAGARGFGYGLGGDVELRAEAIAQEPERTRFTARWRGDSLGEFELGLHGLHNVRNALAAVAVLLALGLDPRLAGSALARFRGVERRFQRVAEGAGITVVDDYAHHPTEVAATLETAREVYRGRRLMVAFQPHLYSRTRAFADEFGRALSLADRVFVTAIYPAREKPIPGVSADTVVRAVEREIEADRVAAVGDLDDLTRRVRAELQAGDVFITLGAGDVFRVAHEIAKELGSRVDA